MRPEPSHNIGAAGDEQDAPRLGGLRRYPNDLVPLDHADVDHEFAADTCRWLRHRLAVRPFSSFAGAPVRCCKCAKALAGPAQISRNAREVITSQYLDRIWRSAAFERHQGKPWANPSRVLCQC